jgi:ABC-type sugar transport system substrate-binding protein
MSLSLRLCWMVVVAALMLLAVLGSARAQEPQSGMVYGNSTVPYFDAQFCQSHSTALR